VLKEGTEAAGSGEQELGRQVKALTRKLKGCGTSGGAGAAAAAGNAKATPGIKAMAATGVCENGGKVRGQCFWLARARHGFRKCWRQRLQRPPMKRAPQLVPRAHGCKPMPLCTAGSGLRG
jgi:hypothetical protein